MVKSQLSRWFNMLIALFVFFLFLFSISTCQYHLTLEPKEDNNSLSSHHEKKIDQGNPSKEESVFFDSEKKSGLGEYSVEQHKAEMSSSVEETRIESRNQFEHPLPDIKNEIDSIPKIDNERGWVVSSGNSSMSGKISGRSIAWSKTQGIFITGIFENSLSFGSVTLTSQGKADIFVAKLDEKGSPVWITSSGGQQDGLSEHIVVSPSGDIYITGWITGKFRFGTIVVTPQKEVAMYVAKLDKNGNFLWVFSSQNHSASGYRLALDSKNNLFVAGCFRHQIAFGTFTLSSQGDSNDAFVAKMSQDGVVMWAVSFGGIGSDCIRGMTLDKNDNLYVAGHFLGSLKFSTFSLSSSGITSDFFVAKLTSKGIVSWMISGGGNGNELVNSITTDKAGNSYLLGHFEQSSRFGNITLTVSSPIKEIPYTSNIFVAKIDQQGQFVWINQMKGNSSYPFVRSITVDSTEHIYIVGEFSGVAVFDTFTLHSSPMINNIYVAKLDNQGKVVHVIGGLGDTRGIATDVVADEAGFVYTTGYFSGTFSFGSTTLTSSYGFDLFVWKYRHK